MSWYSTPLTNHGHFTPIGQSNMQPQHRVVMHIDMNAFFASVEQQANPELQGKPIAVVGGHGRTVITTASYEARKFGVNSASSAAD
jgi:DNA polymerase-4